MNKSLSDAWVRAKTKMKPTVLLYLAWGIFLVSLIGPVTQEPSFFFPAIHMPVGVMILLTPLAAVASHGRSGNAILVFVAMACFLASPVVANAPRRTFRRGMLLPVLAGALLAWVPVALATGYASDELISLGSPMWGYYLFASALTVSSIGWATMFLSGPETPPALDGSGQHPPTPWSNGVDEAPGKPGFPVVVADEDAKPPRSKVEESGH